MLVLHDFCHYQIIIETYGEIWAYTRKELFLLLKEKQIFQEQVIFLNSINIVFIFLKVCSDFIHFASIIDAFCVLLRILPPSGDRLWPRFFHPSQ